MVTLNKDKIKHVVGSVDWGFTNPGVIQVWALDNDDRLYLVHEVYQTGRLIDWWVAQATELKAHFGIEYFICDPAEPGFIAEFSKAHLSPRPANNDVALGLQATAKRLQKAGDNRPRLYVFRDACPNRDRSLVEKRKPTCTAEEFEGYVWQQSADGKPLKEQPLKQDDHGVDGLRYMVMAHETGSPGVFL